MTTQPADRTGILIARLWVEGNAIDGFRARITHALDASSADKSMQSVANPDDLYAVVRTWVESFVNAN